MPIGGKNFSAWSFEPADFDVLESAQERLAFLVRYAVLAPSSHNSQPWKFFVDDRSVVVAPDFSRALPKSDRNHRQLYVSLGCALENLVIAGGFYGYQSAIEYFTEADATMARVRFSGEPLPTSRRPSPALITAIVNRRTNRNKYDSRKIENVFLDELQRYSAPGMRIDVITEDGLKSRITPVVIDAMVEAMDDTDFRFELSNYIRPNLTSESTGMPMYGFGMPTPPSFFAPALLRRFNMNRLSRKEDTNLLSRHTPALIVISTESDGPNDWFEAGRAYERIAVEAETRGLKTAPSAGIIQIGNHHERLRDLLGGSYRPQVFARMGYCEKVPRHSPRLSVAQVISSKA